MVHFNYSYGLFFLCDVLFCGSVTENEQNKMAETPPTQTNYLCLFYRRFLYYQYRKHTLVLRRRATFLHDGRVCVFTLSFVVLSHQAMLNKAHIKLNAKKLYAADGHAVKVRFCFPVVVFG